MDKLCLLALPRYDKTLWSAFLVFQMTKGVHSLLTESSDFATVQPLSLDEVLKKRKEEEEALAKVCPPLISPCNGVDCLGFLSLPQPTTDQSGKFLTRFRYRSHFCETGMLPGTFVQRDWNS